MVVSCKSAFQQKLQFFEEIAQENFKSSSSNSSRRNTIELKVQVNNQQNLETKNFINDYYSGCNNNIIDKNSKPKIETSFKEILDNDKRQVLDLPNNVGDTSVKFHSEVPHKLQDNEQRKSLKKNSELVYKESFIRKAINSVKESILGNSETSLDATYTINTDITNHSNYPVPNDYKKDFHVILRGMFYRNPFNSLSDFNPKNNYSYDDDEFYCFDIFEYDREY